MKGFGYPALLDETMQAKAVPHVRDLLRKQPMTVDELSRILKVRRSVIKLAIHQLRASGHLIENRGSKGGGQAIKGTYHLITEPEGFSGSVRPRADDLVLRSR